MLRKLQAETQQVLDNLFNEHLIPFKVVAQKIIEESPGEYRIHFYDSRLHSVVVEAGKDASIKEQVRSGVLLWLSGTSGPLATPMSVPHPA